VLKNETVALSVNDLRIERSLPHGAVAAVLGMAKKLGFLRLLPKSPARLAKLALAMIVARVIEPAAKLATAPVERRDRGSFLGRRIGPRHGRRG
jgi:hypothetical protein